jgi:transposase
MANRVKMATEQTILGLVRLGWSYRRIASELGVDRETVSRHVKAQKAAGPVDGHVEVGRPEPLPPAVLDSNATIPITGFSVVPDQEGEGTGPSREDETPDLPPAVPGSNATISITGSEGFPESDEAEAEGGDGVGRRSQCAPFRAEILEGLERGLSARRIWQDLTAAVGPGDQGQGDQGKHQFTEGYQSVQRYVRKLQAARPLPFRRMECAPGAEAQVDFGRGAPLVSAEGKRRHPHLLRVVLSHSRKAYSEVMLRQSTEEFLRGLENAFWRFGGVPRTLVVDNLKAAVLRPDWYDPELNPKLESFCQYYGTTLLPTRVRMPRHKGKVERGVGYAQSNAVKGRTFASLAAQNQFLAEWEATIADTRIHGTTRKQVGAQFLQVEKGALLPLPPGRFPCFQEGQRIVNRDGHVEVARSYYSAPAEYVGRTVWARWDGRVVRLFDERMRQIALHAQREPGQFATDAGHIAARKRGGIERGAAWWLGKAGAIGPAAGQWATTIMQERGVHGIRVVMGLVSLTRRHPSPAVEEACRVAQTHGAHRLRDLRQLLKRSTKSPEQAQFEFVQEDPLIRPLADYSKLIPDAFEKTSCTSHTQAEPKSSAGDSR